jgi:hypothetical protein
MRPALGFAILLAAAPVAADTFGGFSGVDEPYLVNQDRVCKPLPISGGTATGAPACEKATADVVAQLSIKPPAAQRGPKATFTATASGKTLTVSRASGDVVVTWSAPDPIGKVVDVFASPYEDRVAVAYTTRRLGKEVTDVVAFVVTKTTGRDTQTGSGSATTTSGQGSGTGSASTAGQGSGTAATTSDPKLTKAIDAARKAPKGKALAAWRAVLGIDAKHSEALFRAAALHAAAKQKADAIAALEALAASDHPDAIEWLVEARFDPAFASLRAEPQFRKATGLDRKGTTSYERLMGFGGQWEQAGTSCDQAEVHLVAARDRSVKLKVKTVCEGHTYASSFSGTWQIDGDSVVLTMPTKGQEVSAKDRALCRFEASGDEDALHCALGHDLDFVVLPTRR